MIHRFRINNFQSIREDVELDLRIPGTTPEMPCFRRSRSRSDIRLPSVVALVGPNGSGKTALLRAIMATANFAAYSYRSYNSGSTAEFLPFLSQDTRNGPTRIEVDFDASWLDADSQKSSSLLRYTLILVREGEFDIVPTSVDYEALHAFPKGRPRRIFERRRDKPIYISKELGVKPHDDRLSSIPPSASVISALAEMKVGSFPGIARDIGQVQTNIVGPDPWRLDTETVIRFYQENKDLVDTVCNRLQRFDLGIGGMRLHKLTDGQWKLLFDHAGLDVPVVLDRESAGTRHLVHIFPQLHFVLDTGNLAIMDALDSDFHSDLSAEILGWFRQEQTNLNNAQLICSLHNLSVLDDLEKEEVFVVQKDRHGVTHAHGARNVSGLRRDGNLQKQYRSGSIGGLPRFG